MPGTASQPRASCPADAPALDPRLLALIEAMAEAAVARDFAAARPQPILPARQRPSHTGRP